MPVIKVQIVMTGTVEYNTDDRETNYPIDELLTFMDVEEDEAEPRDWAEGMVKFDLDNDPSVIMDEISFDFDRVVTNVLEG